MAQTIVSVVLFLVILALLPLAIRWYQQRAPGGASASTASRIVSSLAVGPQQRVVTIEVGPEGARTWLVLGVTPQNVTCLHTLAVAGGTGRGHAATLTAGSSAAPGDPA
jgi:flagellar protein FliO/FliZ